jgi:hypothetical protein
MLFFYGFVVFVSEAKSIISRCYNAKSQHARLRYCSRRFYSCYSDGILKDNHSPTRDPETKSKQDQGKNTITFCLPRDQATLLRIDPTKINQLRLKPYNSTLTDDFTPLQQQMRAQRRVLTSNRTKQTIVLYRPRSGRREERQNKTIEISATARRLCSMAIDRKYENNKPRVPPGRKCWNQF